MDNTLLTETIDTSQLVELLEPGLKQKLFHIIDIADSLYRLQLSDQCLYDIENSKYGEITELLAGCCKFLPTSGVLKLNKQIKKIENGIYDLARISIEVKSDLNVILIFGKIVSSEDSKRYYSAALGLEDSSSSLIDDYKNLVSANTEKLYLIDKSQLNSIIKLPNGFTCVNAIKYAGYIKKAHPPISLFYSGEKKQKLSSLTNAVVFTNLYYKRFELISRRIGSELIDSNCLEYIASKKQVQDILVLWLWGHDMGHFLKERGLGNKLKSDNEYIYEVLHELRSDMFSLYLLKQLSNDIAGVSKEAVLTVFVMEMFRYMRRGSFHNQPDSVSAYLMFKYMLEMGVLENEPSSNKIILNYNEIGKIIDKLLMECMDMFMSEDFNRADSLFKMLSIDKNCENIEKDLELDLSFNDIPEYTEFI